MHRIPVYRSLAELSSFEGSAVVSVGNFDGVHKGHREILAAIAANARKLSARAVAVTFDPHPEVFLRPNAAPRLITPIDARVNLLAETGIDAVLVLPFDAVLAQLSAREFVRTILVDALRVCALHEGGNFRFGHRAEAGVKELAAFGKEFGFELSVHEAIYTHGIEVSSSAIRELIAAGQMQRARWLLGRSFSVQSSQKRDRGVGAKLLVPTINLAPYDELLPVSGVYITQLKISGRQFQSITNIGNRPTFEGAGFSVETHILNFEPIPIEETTSLELTFLKKLRDEKMWSSPDALKQQILMDISVAKRFFSRLGYK